MPASGSSADAAARHLPLTPVVLHLLLALADGDRHGYAVAQEVERLTHGTVRLGPGTLYGSTRRLLDAGLIAESPTAAGGDGADERRRYYRLTPLGRDVARAESRRLDRLVRRAGALDLLQEPR